MLNKKIVSLILALLIVLLAMNKLANAHEMWIEPVKYKVEKNDTIYAHEKVGQNFKGNQYSYLNTSYERLDITINNKTRAVKSRIGDIPAIHEVVKEEGLIVLSAITTVSDVNYKTWEKFETFIKSKRLDWVLEQHKKRGLPDKGFTEAYSRFPKALIQIGDGKGADSALGMRFEWVLETNPYTTALKPDGYIKARLLWEGKPMKQAHVNVFNKVNDKLFESDLYTDDEGRVEIPQAKGGEFLINSVQMIEPSKKVKKETGAVWESLWASITYKISN